MTALVEDKVGYVGVVVVAVFAVGLAWRVYGVDVAAGIPTVLALPRARFD